MNRLRTNFFTCMKGLAAISLVLSSLGNVIGVKAAPAALQSSSQPQVLAVTPGSGFLEERNARVEIAFDLPMDRARTEAAFSIQPELPHDFRWKDAQTLQIQFREPFAPGTQYALTLTGGDTGNSARSRDGIPLSEDYRWYYWLAPFEASVTTPHPAQVILKFNTAIDRARSGPPFAIEPAVDGEWRWGSDQTVFFTASAPFPPAQQYTIRLTGPLYDRFGAIPSEGLDLNFTSPPPVKSVEPPEGVNVQASFGPIQIVFTEPVDPQSAQNAFSITPAISGRFAWSQSKADGFQDTLSFLPDTLFERGTEYTVSLSPDLKARAGNPLMLSAYSWSFTVDSYYSSYTAPATFGDWGYNVQVVDVNGPRKVQFAAGKGLISFELYRYDLIDFVKLYSEEAHSGAAVPNISLPDPEEERMVASWYYARDESSAIDQTVIPPDVPAGLYVLNMKHEGRSYGQLFLVLTRSALTAKLSGDQLFVWVSDINGASVPDAEIRLYSDQGEKIREGKTDEQGIYRVTVPAGYSPMLVSARTVEDRETDVALTGLTSDWNSWGWWPRQSGERLQNLIYTYTDRPIYRPGQTVNFKSILRYDQDVKYSLLPAGTPVSIAIRDPKDNLLQSSQAELSGFGSVHGSFTIAEGATLGEYSIEVTANGQGSRQSFKVEDYRKPDFSVTLSPADPDHSEQIVAGEAFDLDIDVRYFFDEPVADAQLTYTYYELYPTYDWWNPDPEDIQYDWAQASSQSQTITQKTGADGKAHLRVQTERDPHLFDFSYFDDWRSSLRTKTYAVEVSADDGSNQPVSGTYLYKVVNAAEKLSLDVNGYFQTANTPFTVQASVRDLLDRSVARHAMTLSIKEWQSTGYEYVHMGKEFPLLSDANGRASQAISLPPGYYQLVLSAQDLLGNEVSYERWVGIFSSGSEWSRRSNSSLEIMAERPAYKPYETARFMIESGFSGPALLTFERGSVVHTKQVMLTAPLTTVEAQIIPEDAPNIFVTVNAWEAPRRIEEDGNEYGYYSNIPDSYLRIARTELLVEADRKALDVAIHTDREVYAPGEEVTVEIDVKDRNGRPVEAEVSLALVDEAIFSLSNELSEDIFQAFYGPRPLSVETYDSMRPYREIHAAGRGGGGDEGMVAEPRRDFPDTAAWFPALVSDADGRATVTFTLPDNLTSWRLSAKAVTLNHQVGEARTNIETKQDLLLRPFLPRVLTTGDQAELTVMVHNYSDRARDVQVTIKGQELEIRNEATRSITVPAGGAMPVGWRVIPTGTTATRLTFTAVSDDRASDSIELPMPVQPLAVADVQSLSGRFDGNLSLDLPLPADALADNSVVTLRLSRSPASTLLDGLEYLTGYPYGCVEQTMSRAMPNAVLGRASSQLGIGGEEFRARIDPLIAASLQKLYGFQHENGGWGWWFDDASDEYQTAWVLHGLAVIQSSGVAVEPQVIEDAVGYLNENLEGMDIRTRAYALYSMALAGNGNLEATRLLADSSARELDPFSQAALALALKQLGDDPRAEAIIDLLEISAMRNDGLVYWPQARSDGEYHSKTMASTIRTTAFALSAILNVEGKDNPLVRPAADYLIGERTGYGWSSTNETSFTILALTDYLSSQQTEAGTSEFTVELNGAKLATGALEPGRMFASLEIPFSRLRVGNNRLQLEAAGTGPLYYDLITRYTLSREAVDPAGSIGITRQYLDPATKDPLEEITAGQLVLVQLTVKMPQAGSFMLIEDHLPGGLEALNERLNSTSHVSASYEYYEDSQYRWQEYGYNNKEIYGDRVTFFVTDMRSGITTFSYLARATTTGTFQALPAETYAMYDPLLWGRSSDEEFVVEP